MNRRRLLIGGACCAAHHVVGTVGGLAQTATPDKPRYFCATIDTVANRRRNLPVTPRSLGGRPGAPMTPGTSSPLVLTPYGTAFARLAWLPTDGLTPSSNMITLGVHFMGGTPDQIERTKAGASRWLTNGLEKRIAFRFDVDRERSQIRVSFDPKLGNVSAVGRAAASRKKTVSTMNLADAFSPVIEHEFGHALCLEHEHKFPGAVRWNVENVIADMLPYWKKVEIIREQITDRAPDRMSCIGDPDFNPRSAMI